VCSSQALGSDLYPRFGHTAGAAHPRRVQARLPEGHSRPAEVPLPLSMPHFCMDLDRFDVSPTLIPMPAIRTCRAIQTLYEHPRAAHSPGAASRRLQQVHVCHLNALDTQRNASFALPLITPLGPLLSLCLCSTVYTRLRSYTLLTGACRDGPRTTWHAPSATPRGHASNAGLQQGQRISSGHGPACWTCRGLCRLSDLPT
jgi:hypothetical protein